MIVVGMHYGAIELPVTILSGFTGHSVMAPMETVDDPALAAWFAASRRRVGVNVIPIRDARRALVGAIRRGESVGLVADRDLTGSGLPVPLFGHPAPIAAGPALLALETGAPIYAASTRRTRRGPLRRPPRPRPGPARGPAPRAAHRLHAVDRQGVRGDRRRRARAVVGRVPPDLARPRRG